MDAPDQFLIVCQALSREQTKGVVEAYLTIEEKRSSLSELAAELNHSPPGPAGGGALSVLKSAHDELAPSLSHLRLVCKACAARSAATQWAAELSPVGPVIAAGLGAVVLGANLRSAEHLQRLCGLHPAAQVLSPNEAIRLYHRIHQEAQEVPLTAALALAANTGRNIRARWEQNGSIPRKEILDWLVRPPFSPFLYRLLVRAGKSFAQQRGAFDNRFSRAIRERLAIEKRMNASGGYEGKAKQELRRAPPEELPDYQKGRLPLSRLEELARNWVLRQFLTEFYKRLKATGALGSEPIEEP